MAITTKKNESQLPCYLYSRAWWRRMRKKRKLVRWTMKLKPVTAVWDIYESYKVAKPLNIRQKRKCEYTGNKAVLKRAAKNHHRDQSSISALMKQNPPRRECRLKEKKKAQGFKLLKDHLIHYHRQARVLFLWRLSTMLWWKLILFILYPLGMQCKILK
jgi:hypothetical protein